MTIDEVVSALRDRATELRNLASTMGGTDGGRERAKIAEELGRLGNAIEKKIWEDRQAADMLNDPGLRKLAGKLVDMAEDPGGIGDHIIYQNAAITSELVKVYERGFGDGIARGAKDDTKLAALLEDILDEVEWSASSQVSEMSPREYGLCPWCGRDQNAGHGPKCDVGLARAALAGRAKR